MTHLSSQERAIRAPDGRGTTDDKGPVIEALYAMKLLRDSGVKLDERVRLIIGM